MRQIATQNPPKKKGADLNCSLLFAYCSFFNKLYYIILKRHRSIHFLSPLLSCMPLPQLLSSDRKTQGQDVAAGENKKGGLSNGVNSKESSQSFFFFLFSEPRGFSFSRASLNIR